MAYIFIDNTAWVCYTKNKRMVLSMEQCKVNGQDVYIRDVDDIYYYLRQLTNDDLTDIVESIIDGKLSEKDDKIHWLEIDLEEAQDEIEGLEVEAYSLQEELEKARETISELQEVINEYKYQ